MCGAEWRFLCAAYNLRKIWKFWWRPRVLAAATLSQVKREKRAG